jgi:hypothetical protein
MKANHNSNVSSSTPFKVVFNISKIQDESKSQPRRRVIFFPFSCFQYFKDTIPIAIGRKQITTR